MLGGIDMTVLNVAMFGSDELAKDIAKATDQRDVHTYVHKELNNGEAKIISIIRPARFPERLRPLLNAISAGRVGLIEINEVDATLGEVIVAFASSSIKRGIAVIRPLDGGWVDQDMVEKMFLQAGLDGWQFMQPDGLEIRNQLYALMEQINDELIQSAQSPLVVSIDQYFNVKGIGLVAIGYVQCGTLKVHDELHILPAKGNGSTKSLQVMDDDVDSAVTGDRVGVALRNLREEALHRGCMIIHPESQSLIRHDNSKIKMKNAPFQKRQLANEDVIHAAVDLQFVVGRIKQVDGEIISEISGRDCIIISKSDKRVKFIHPNHYDYYETLRSKLFWGHDKRNA